MMQLMQVTVQGAQPYYISGFYIIKVIQLKVGRPFFGRLTLYASYSTG